MEEDDVLCRFGTPLEPLEEDEIPAKKPISIEDQIVTDQNGRRRFHGAFTGGFSAGFWNTVGSLEGWTPKEFKSSRDEKTKLPVQKPSDFMDDEDLGEFGFAPQRVQTTADFTSNKEDASRKRKVKENVNGPIPGIPVLHQLLEPSKDNIAIRLIKRMGWKEGQGVGARQTKKEKKIAAKQNEKEQYNLKKYGCDMGPIAKEPNVQESSESDLSDAEEITFAPDDFEPYICSAKDNCFGLGYTGLSRDPVLKQHVNLFGPLEILDKNQKLSIRGKGFGVGALEEEDEDIYHIDDMSNYDFSLEKKTKSQPQKLKEKSHDFYIIEGFSSPSDSQLHTKKVFIVKIPPNYTPRNWLHRKSRFEPLDEKRAALLKQHDEIKIKGLGRHDLTLDDRRAILESNPSTSSVLEDKNNLQKETSNNRKLTYLEKINQKYKEKENKKENILNILASKSDNFVRSEIIKEDGTVTKGLAILQDDVQKENEKLKNEANKITKSLETTPTTFKPFLGDTAKQERYEKFLEKSFSSDEDVITFLSSIQPSSMSEWDRCMEKKEFEQARKMYKPLKGIMSDRFVSETTVDAEKKQKDENPDRRGKTIRTKDIWRPVALLCKRFNVAEPFVNMMEEETKNQQKKPKFSVFDYLESSVNKKEDFVTPSVIPKNDEEQKQNIHIESAPKIIAEESISNQKENLNKSEPKRVSAKDLFAKDLSISGTFLNTSMKLPEIISESKVKEVSIENQLQTTMLKNKKLKENPKTEFEEKIEELKNVHPSEKKNLYKSVFETASDSEEEIENKVSEQAQQSVKTKDLLATFSKPASELNILRNNSPPRGIFAAYFQETGSSLPTDNSKLSKNIKESNSEKPLDALEIQDNMYGPKIPAQISNVISSVNQTSRYQEPTFESSHIDNKLQKLLKKQKHKPKIVEEWVEVTELTSSKKASKKDKKKHRKKEKSKHKKYSSSSEDSSFSTDSSDSENLKAHKSHKKKSKKRKKSKKHRK